MPTSSRRSRSEARAAKLAPEAREGELLLVSLLMLVMV